MRCRLGAQVITDTEQGLTFTDIRNYYLTSICRTRSCMDFIFLRRHFNVRSIFRHNRPVQFSLCVSVDHLKSKSPFLFVACAQKFSSSTSVLKLRYTIMASWAFSESAVRWLCFTATDIWSYQCDAIDKTTSYLFNHCLYTTSTPDRPANLTLISLVSSSIQIPRSPPKKLTNCRRHNLCDGPYHHLRTER